MCATCLLVEHHLRKTQHTQAAATSKHGYPKRLKASLLALSLLPMMTLLPHMYSCLWTFVLVSLPSVASTVTAPKCLFVFSNIIVVFLVSQSKLSHSGSSESLNTGDNNGDVVDAKGDMLQRQEEELVMEAFAPIVEESEQEHNVLVVVEQKEDTVTVCEAVVQMDQLEEEDDVVFGEIDEIRGEVLEEEGRVESMLEEEIRGGEQQREEEELEESDLPPVDELNRRVEDFIARFNMERQLEARMLVCCC